MIKLSLKNVFCIALKHTKDIYISQLTDFTLTNQRYYWVLLFQMNCIGLKKHYTIKKIKIISHLPGASVMIQGVSGILQQLFLNLFLNAIAAMPNGGILTLNAESRVGDVLLSITDTGVGIRGKNVDKIFDPFFTTASLGEGIGLGLSIAYTIVKQHAGTIEVNSAGGKGSTFIVKLPK